RVLLSLDTQRRPAPDLHGYAQALTLTPAQARVLHSLAHGLRPAQIAAALGIAASTVRGHVTALRRKTGYRSTADLIMAMQRLPPLRCSSRRAYCTR
ncbi:MAG: helix-turn-helix transcriptional regulator, partial [Rubrivivax sp.]|nr:helix-turn-helix transcriptional regulator [Rubrivivax sp.]